MRVGNRVTFGNLLTLPVGGGLLYVEPLYVQAATGTSFPLLQQVIVAFGNQIAIGTDLTDALDKLFGGSSGAPAPAPGDPAPSTPPGGGTNAELRAALADVQKAFEDGKAALAKGDFAAYGRTQQRLEEALERANSAGPGGRKNPATPAPAPPPTAEPLPPPPVEGAPPPENT